MKPLTEIEENPLEFVQWAKAQVAEQTGNDPQRLFAHIRAKEAESRARGLRFVDYSQIPDQPLEPALLREDPPPPSLPGTPSR